MSAHGVNEAYDMLHSIALTTIKLLNLGPVYLVR